MTTRPACGNHRVFTSQRDDQSGNSWFRIVPIPNKQDFYTITAVNKATCQRAMFSNPRRGAFMDVFTHDEGTGQQQYYIPGAPLQDKVDLPKRTTLEVNGRVGNNNYFSASSNCARPEPTMVQEDGRKGRQYWTFDKVEGSNNRYNIRVTSGISCDAKYLSAEAHCGKYYPILVDKDDGSGLQQWIAQPVANKDDTFTFRIGRGRVCHHKRNILSATRGGNRPILVNREDNFGSEHFYAPGMPDTQRVRLPEAGRIRLAANRQHVNQGVWLAGYENNCNANNAILERPASDTANVASERFVLKKVEGSKALYNIIIKGGRSHCEQKYLSAYGNCNNNVYYVSRDDNSGLQQWLAIPVEGKKDTYKFKIIRGRDNCDHVLLGTWGGSNNVAIASETQANTLVEWIIEVPPKKINWGNGVRAPTDEEAADEDTENTSDSFRIKKGGDDIGSQERPVKNGSPAGKSNRKQGWTFTPRRFNRRWGHFRLNPQGHFLTVEGNEAPKDGDKLVFTTAHPGRRGLIYVYPSGAWRHVSGLWVTKEGDDLVLREEKKAGKCDFNPKTDNDEEKPIGFGDKDKPFSNPVADKAEDEKVDDDEVDGNETDNTDPANFGDDDDKDGDDDETDDGEGNDSGEGEDQDNESGDNNETDDKETDDQDSENVDDNEVDGNDTKDSDDFDFGDDEADDDDTDDDEETDENDEELKGDLDLEKGHEEKIVQPAEDGKIPAGNCCDAISRKDEAKAITGAGAAKFAAAYQTIYEEGWIALLSYGDAVQGIKGVKKNMPKSQALKNFNAAVAAGKSGDNEPVEIPQKKAAEIFRGMVEEIRFIIDVIDFGKLVEMKSGEKGEKRWPVRREAKKFFETFLKPARYYYGVFNKAPLVNNSVITLQNNMITRLNTFTAALSEMNKLGLNTNGFNRKVRALVNNIRNVSKKSKDQHRALRRVLTISRNIMILINKRAVAKGLQNNEEFMAKYNEAANALFRAGEARSIRCLALWALKRRDVEPTRFENQVINKQNAFKNFGKSVVKETGAAPLNKMGEAYATLFNGYKGEITETSSAQLADTKAYIDSVWEVTNELIKADSNKAEEFFTTYYLEMGSWRFALHNQAL